MPKLRAGICAELNGHASQVTRVGMTDDIRNEKPSDLAGFVSIHQS